MCNQNEDYEYQKHYAGYMESVDEKGGMAKHFRHAQCFWHIQGSVEKYWGCFFCFIVFCIFAL